MFAWNKLKNNNPYCRRNGQKGKEKNWYEKQWEKIGKKNRKKITDKKTKEEPGKNLYIENRHIFCILLKFLWKACVVIGYTLDWLTEWLANWQRNKLKHI